MDLKFLSAGKYRLGINVVVVTPKDVEDEKVFTVKEDRARELIEAKRATEVKIKASDEPPKEITLEDVKEMTVPELKAYATKMDIDLEGKTKSDDIKLIVLKTFVTK